MRHRAAAGLSVLGIGALLIALTIFAMATPYGLHLNPAVTGTAGVLLLLFGLFLLITDLLEVWLNRGQAALVDGLQAG